MNNITTQQQKTAGEILKERRQLKCITQDELAQLLSVHITDISRWENNVHKPRPIVARKLASILGGQPNDYRQ